MKKFALLLMLFGLALCIAGCVVISDLNGGSTVEADPYVPGSPHAVTGYIVVHGFEWGPGVSRVIVELDTEVDAVVMNDALKMVTAYNDREVTDAYLSDSLGNATKFSSSYVSFDLVTNYDCTGSPFEVDESTELNVWADEYIVNTTFTVVVDGAYYNVSLNADCIDNRLCPEVERFTDRGSYTGEYLNPTTGEMDTLTLTYAAYEPDSLESWEQNPLIIWLHGLGEGGTDIEKAILGNEVSALTETEIQSYFVSGDQIGAYVLVVQTPTYWMDNGSGTYHKGDDVSRYTEILMDLIFTYVDEHPDVDPDRVYIGGASNGGYMTINMLINYPTYFAAAFPCCAAYAYYEFAKDQDGSYRTAWGTTQTLGTGIKTDTVFFTDDKAEAVIQTPIWFIQAVSDYLVPPTDYALPIYRKLLLSGATNCWYSLYVDVTGTESTNTVYSSHWSWIYLLNDEVAYVQDPEKVLEASTGSEEMILSPQRPSNFTNGMDMQSLMAGFNANSQGGTILAYDEDGNTYSNFFEWLNAQVRD